MCSRFSSSVCSSTFIFAAAVPGITFLSHGHCQPHVHHTQACTHVCGAPGGAAEANRASYGKWMGVGSEAGSEHTLFDIQDCLARAMVDTLICDTCGGNFCNSNNKIMLSSHSSSSGARIHGGTGSSSGSSNQLTKTCQCRTGVQSMFRHNSCAATSTPPNTRSTLHAGCWMFQDNQAAEGDCCSDSHTSLSCDNLGWSRQKQQIPAHLVGGRGVTAVGS